MGFERIAMLKWQVNDLRHFPIICHLWDDYLSLGKTNEYDTTHHFHSGFCHRPCMESFQHYQGKEKIERLDKINSFYSKYYLLFLTAFFLNTLSIVYHKFDAMNIEEKVPSAIPIHSGIENCFKVS